MPEHPFKSKEILYQTYAAGLERLLDQDEVGTYILVQANASMHPDIMARLEGSLRTRFHSLAERCRELFRHGRIPREIADDDLLVFLKLLSIGFDEVQPIENRVVDDWEIYFNHFRSFRPCRITCEGMKGIRLNFDGGGFNFNKPHLRKEALWSGKLNGLEIELLYNKFPFVDFHGLLVPDRNANESQYLSRPYHLYMWELVDWLSDSVPGIGFGYNSLGAFASVNHLHFQMFLRDDPLPLENPKWSHNGGDRCYPLHCTLLRDPEQAWEAVRELHQGETSYNLVYLPGRMYVIPRRKQGQYQQAEWTAGFAWYEACGCITTFNRSDFECLDGSQIEAEMSKLAVTG